jgi:hypothetical protein
MFAHVHDFPELLSWWGTDPDNPEDTSGMGLVLGEEEIPLDRSWVAYIPAGMKHMPTRPPGAKITRLPVCHWTSGPGAYTREGEGSESHDNSSAAQTEQRLATGESNARYIVFGYPEHVKRPAYMRPLDDRFARPMAYIDETVIPDAEFGCDVFWLLPGNPSKSGQVIMDKHTVPYGTSIVINAMNYPDITDLCGQAELWIGGEKFLINKSFGAYIPPDVEHGPLTVRGLNCQTLFMMSHPVGKGIQRYRGGR